MSSLRQVVSDHLVGKHPTDPGMPQDRRSRHDRRAYDRRSNVYPFESREARLRFAAQAVGFGTYDLDCLSCDSYWSPELRELAGLPQDKTPLSIEQVENLIHPDDRPRVLDKLWASLDPGSDGHFEDDHRLLCPNGKEVWVRVKCRVFFAGEGEARKPLAATGVVMDITGSRAAQQALAESQEELDKMVESAIDCIITIGADQRIIRFNPSASRTFDCPADQAIGSRVERFMPERYRAGHEDQVRRFAEGEVSAQALDAPRRFTGMRASGEEFPFEATITKVNVNGHARMTTFMRDITDRVRADEALQRSTEDLELAVRGAHIGIWQMDIRSGKVEWSERTYQLFGLSAEEAMNLDRVMAAVHPEDRPRIKATVQEALRKRNETYNFDCRVVWPDGSVHWIAAIGCAIYDRARNKGMGLRGVALDITERKDQEEALRRSKADLELAVRAANLGIWHRDLKTGKMEFSDRQYQLMGIPVGEPVTQERYLANIHPEDRPQIENAVRLALQRREMYDIEFRVTWPDGSVRWLACMGRILYHGSSTAQGVRGITLDITERKQREEVLKHRKEELETVVEDRTKELAQSKAVLEQFRIFIEQAPSNIAMFDRGMNYVAASLGWGRALNENVHAIIGRNHYQLHPDIPEKWKEAHRAALAGTPTEKDEDLWVRADGSERWMHWAVYPWRHGTGQIGGVVIAGEDITQRKRAEQDLQESEIRFRSTFEQVAVGLAHVGLDGRFLRVNAKFSAIVRYGQEELLQKTFQEITHPDDLEEDLRNLASLQGGVIPGYTMEKRYIRKDGESVWCNLTVSLVHQPSGKPGYFVSVVEDIQARKEAENALAEEREARQRMLAQQVAERTAELAISNDALVRSNIELKHFAHVAAHDLQTPLRSIAGFAQLLQKEAEGRLSGREIDWLNQVTENTKRLQRLIQELLSYTRLDMQARPLEVANLRELFEEVVATLTVPIGEANAKVTCHGLPTLPVDRTQFAQLLQNLIENAIKYRGDEPPRVSVSCERRGDEWIFSIADNGIGIDPKHRERIFEIFRRLHTYDEIPGTGIGLATCQRIVERHGGRIWVESEKGKGSTFYFALPDRNDLLPIVKVKTQL